MPHTFCVPSICLDAPCMFVCPQYVLVPLNYGGMEIYGGFQTYWGVPNTQEEYKNIWVSKHAGDIQTCGKCPNMGIQIWGTSKHTGGIQTWGVSTYRGASKHMGVSKHGASIWGHPNIWGVQTGGIQKYGGILTCGGSPNIWWHQNILGAAKHTDIQGGFQTCGGILTWGCSNIQGEHPNIWGGFQTYGGIPVCLSFP